VYAPLALTILWVNGFPDFFVRVDFAGQILMVTIAATVVAAVISSAWGIATAVEMIRTMRDVRRGLAELRRLDDDRA
jgi:predicted Abi (CAAX) family protease